MGKLIIYLFVLSPMTCASFRSESTQSTGITDRQVKTESKVSGSTYDNLYYENNDSMDVHEFRTINESGAKLNENFLSDKISTYNNFYYDWGFGAKFVPGVAPQDGKMETPTTTDISCWDCDEEQDESCLLVRCDYTLLYNGTFSPRGYSCIEYQYVVKTKTYNKAACSYTPSSTYDPCEEVFKHNTSRKMQHCRICWDDGCNAIVKESVFPSILLLLLGLGLLFCLFVLCIGAKNKFLS